MKTNQTKADGPEGIAEPSSSPATSPSTPTTEPKPGEAATVPAETGAAETDAPDDATSDGLEDEMPELAAARREARSYRRQLREREAELADARAMVESLQRAEVERMLADGDGGTSYRNGIASRTGTFPAEAFWRSDVTLADLLRPDGTVDAAKVRQAVGAAAKLLGVPYQPIGPYAPFEGKVASSPRRPDWVDAFRDA